MNGKKTLILYNIQTIFCQHQGEWRGLGLGYTIIIIYRHVYHSCTVSTSSTFDIPKIWKHGILGQPRGWKTGCIWGGRAGKQNKGVAACFGVGGCRGGGDTEGQRDTRTIHMLARRSPFRSHWPTNQGMAVTSFIIGYFFFLLNVCRLPASFSFILPHRNFIRRYSKSTPARFVIYCPQGDVKLRRRRLSARRHSRKNQQFLFFLSFLPFSLLHSVRRFALTPPSVWATVRWKSQTGHTAASAATLNWFTTD